MILEASNAKGLKSIKVTSAWGVIGKEETKRNRHKRNPTPPPPTPNEGIFIWLNYKY
jgi:hypothetical protein